jgi:hypothetical protein
VINDLFSARLTAAFLLFLVGSEYLIFMSQAKRCAIKNFMNGAAIISILACRCLISFSLI